MAEGGPGEKCLLWKADQVRKNVSFPDLSSLSCHRGSISINCRAYLTICIYRLLKSDRTEEENFLNYVSGWLIEILQAAALIADDIMDNSEMRRGAPCWFRNPDVGMNAINDAFMLENTAYFLLLKYFLGEDNFIKMLQLVNENVIRTVLGQSLDLKMAAGDAGPNFER